MKKSQSLSKQASAAGLASGPALPAVPAMPAVPPVPAAQTSRSKGSDGLTVAQRCFVHAYRQVPDVRAAALQAGYAASSAAVLGARLLKHAAVRAALAGVADVAVEQVAGLAVDAAGAMPPALPVVAGAGLSAVASTILCATASAITATAAPTITPTTAPTTAPCQAAMVSMPATPPAAVAELKPAPASAAAVQQRAHLAGSVSASLPSAGAAQPITLERTLQEIARMAFFDPRKLFDAHGVPLPVQELDDDTAAAVAGIDVQENFAGLGKERAMIGYTKKYKLCDKKAALDLLMKHFGGYREEPRLASSSAGSVASLLKSIRDSGLQVVPEHEEMPDGRHDAIEDRSKHAMATEADVDMDESMEEHDDE